MGLKEDMSRHLERFGRKTSAMLEEARLRGRISALESEIKNLYTTVGTSVFSMWKHQDVDTGRLVKYFEAINRKLEEIEEKKEMILQIKEESSGKTPEERPEKPVRPLLPDYGGKMDGAAAEEAGKPAGTAAQEAGEPAGTAAGRPETGQATAGSEGAALGGNVTKTGAPEDNVVIEEEENGTALPGDPAAEPSKEEYVYCSRCGAECPADANFCRKCGMKLG